MIEENFVVVARQNAVAPLMQKITGYRRSWERVKIGVTSDPERRWNQHIPDGWEKMVLLYEAYTPAIAREIEQKLIAEAREHHFRLGTENINPGGEGITDEDRPNYVYVLVTGRRRF
jgi:hypothetical protein